MIFSSPIFNKNSGKPSNGMGEMKDMADYGHDDPIPYYDNLRRIPKRYRETLPLSFMKQCQCVVIGSARGVLTVAISAQQDISMLETISQLLGHSIFPVLVSPVTIRLVIQRLEHDRRRKTRIIRQRSLLDPSYIHAMVIAVTNILRNKPGQE